MSDLLKRLIEEFEAESEDWIDEEVGDFVISSSHYANHEVTGLMALGYFICLSDEERDAAWAKFQLEKEP